MPSFLLTGRVDDYSPSMALSLPSSTFNGSLMRENEHEPSRSGQRPTLVNAGGINHPDASWAHYSLPAASLMSSLSWEEAGHFHDKL